MSTERASTRTGKRTPWVVMLVAFLAGVAAAFNQFKVPPVLPGLLPGLGLDMAAGGWLMSISAVAALVLSIPAALVLNRVGLKRVGMASLACIVAGSGAGALAGNPAGLFAARLLEGVGMSIVAIVSPALISVWFAPHERGLPMGIWAAWVPAGSVIAFNTAPALQTVFGWRGVWWFSALFSLVVLVLFGLLAREPARAGRDADLAVPRLSVAARGLFNPASWLLALVFGTFVFGQLGYSTWAPAYLTAALAIPTATASFYTGLSFLSGIVSNVSAGWLLNHIPHRPAVPVLAMAVSAILFWWSFRLGSPGLVAPYMLALGLVSNVIPTAVYTLAPETTKQPEAVGLAIAAINVVSNLGVLLGPPILGAVVAGGRWAQGSLLLVAVTGVGVAAALMAWRAMRGR